MEQSSVLLSSDTNELEIVEFHIDDLDKNGNRVSNYFGVNVAKVREIIRVPQIWKVFNSHPAVTGMIKLRNKVITVLDLSVILNRYNQGIKSDKIIVLEFNRLSVGVLVHGVTRIHRISWGQVEPPGQGMETTNVTGLVKMDDRIILIVDFEKIVGEICSEYSLHDLEGTLQQVNSEQSPSAPKTILVADDSPFIRNTITSSLRGAGYVVEEFENGELAYNAITEKLARFGERFVEEVSLIITDIEMPKMDGLHLTSLIRKEPFLKEFPIIIFSSMASEDNKRKWGELGANAIITKPDLPYLVELIEKLSSR